MRILTTLLEVVGTSDESLCEGCGEAVAGVDLIQHEGQKLCEECYFDKCHRIKVCDPWGERSKRVFREMEGMEGTEGLTDLQVKIFDFIRSRGEVSAEEICRKFGLKPVKLHNQFALLRQCQLVKGKRSDGEILIVPW